MIRILAVGKLKDPSLKALCDDFAQRITRWAKIEVLELKDQDPDKEAAAMIAKLGVGPVYALDERGDTMTSRKFAKLLAAHGSPTFLIGGPDGHGDAVRSRADHLLSLSPMTFTHETARYLLLEQIYRGLAIDRGHPYHRD